VAGGHALARDERPQRRVDVAAETGGGPERLVGSDRVEFVEALVQQDSDVHTNAFGARPQNSPEGGVAQSQYC